MSDNILYLKKEFKIESIVSMHDFVYKSTYIYRSEYQDYWKLLYVKRGSAEISFTDGKENCVLLEQGHLFLESPEEYYSIRSATEDGVVMFTAGFFCDSDKISLLKNRLLNCQSMEKTLLTTLASEGGQCFSPRLLDSSSYHLERRYDQPFGGEQVVGSCMELLLISLLRQYSEGSKDTEKDSSILQEDVILFNRITDYYSRHITEHLRIEQICQEFDVGRSRLQRIFRSQTGYSAIDYFCRMRIRAAESMIREQKGNLTDTAAALGYTSIQYFSKQFKKITGMNPSSYQKSIHSAKKDSLYQHIEL